MDVLELLQTPLAERIGLVLVHSLWQGALVALALAAALRLLRQARHRYLAACAAMGLVLVLPLATFSLISEVTYRNVGAVLATTARSLASSWTLPGQEASLLSGTEWLNLLLPWAVGVWAVGVAVLSVRLAGGLFATGRLRQGAIPAAAWIDQRVRELALQLGVRKRIRAAITDRIASPVVLGWIKPLVLLPMGALTRLTPQQLEAILVHELAHVRRHDYLINLVQRIAETLLFYHPAVWWIGRRMREEREYCCDDIAITTCGNVRLYAHALVSLQMSAQSYPLAMAATGDPLLGRISRLMQRPGDGPSPSVRTSASGTFLIVACVLAVAMRSVVFPAAEARAHSSHTLGQ
ncbi:MAG TPA: M56 family metallopeptidase, partial [Rhodothermales bacterium]|nr:M56 family metallopeptidase [Rhodothermales bacterium]